MAVDNNGNSNTYEEARKQRLDENKKKIEGLGITRSLAKLSTPEKKAKLKSKAANTELVELRRSSRSRNQIAYTDDVDIELSPMRKKARFSSSSLARHAERPSCEIKVAKDEDKKRALKAAEEFQTSLKSGKPSFVKSMLKSHVYRGFWLGLVSDFCKDHMPKKDLNMILEDENGSTCKARFLADRTGLSGGWRGFALDHKLDDGDAVLFELVNPDKFKVYIFRASSPSLSQRKVDVAEEDGSTKEKSASEDQNSSNSGSSKKQNSKKVKASKVSNNEKNKSTSEVISSDMKSVEKNGSIEKNGGKDESAVNMEVEPLKENEKRKKHVAKRNLKKAKEEHKVSNDGTLKPQNESATEVISNDTKSVEKNGVLEKNDRKKKTVAVNSGIKSVQENGKQKVREYKPRKKPAERLFRRRV